MYKYLIKFFILFILTSLFSCSVQNNKKLSIGENSIKTREEIAKNLIITSKNSEFKENIKVKKIVKERITPLSKNQSSSNEVIFEFKNERLLEGVDNQLKEKFNIAEKAVQATFKMLKKMPSTGMESLAFNKNFSNAKPISYKFDNFYNLNSKQNSEPIESNILILLPSTGLYKQFGVNIRKAIEMAIFEDVTKSVKFIYYNTANLASLTGLQKVIEENKPRLVLGPLLRKNLIKIKKLVKQYDIPLISFTNDKSLSEKQIWISGFSPDDQVDKLIQYVKKCKKNRIGFIGIENEYGFRVLKMIREKLKKIPLKKTILFNEKDLKNKSELNYAVQDFLDYDELKNESEDNLEKLDAIFLIGDTNFIIEIMPMLTYYDLDTKLTDILGTDVMNDDLLIREHSLINVKFPLILQSKVNEFEEKWREMWISSPDVLSRLGYDLAKISIWYANQNEKFSNLVEKKINRFSILGNKFIFNQNGSVYRPSSLFKIDTLGKIKKIARCS